MTGITLSLLSETTTTLGTGLGITATSTVTLPSNEVFTVNSNGTYSTVNINQISISNNSYYMENNSTQPQQVQVAVFEIERDNKLQVTSTKHIDTFWVEQKPKADLKLVVAKKLAKDVDLDKIVIKEMFRVFF